MVLTQLRAYSTTMQKTKKSIAILPLVLLALISSPIFSKADENEKTAQTFNEEINRFGLFVKKVFNANIHFSKEWAYDRATFSASAMSMSGRVINVSGFDYRANSLAAFRLGLCHETGHYLAGAPFLKINPNSIENTLNRMELSAEGQADYFAPYCLKKYLDYLRITNSNADNHTAPVSASITTFCRNSRSDIQEQHKCEYAATAAVDLVNYLNNHYAKAGQLNPAIPFEAHEDTRPSSHTLDGRREYPTLNCRLQTYLAGTVCENDHLPVSQFICASEEGARPACWYQGN